MCFSSKKQEAAELQRGKLTGTKATAIKGGNLKKKKKCLRKKVIEAEIKLKSSEEMRDSLSSNKSCTFGNPLV